MAKIIEPSYESNPILQVCPECKNGIILDTYTGDTICDSCGLIISEKALDISNFDKNMFSYEEIRDRLSSGFVDTLFTPKPYLNTIIKKHEIKSKDFNRIANLDYHNNDSEVRNLLIAIRYLKLISSKLKLSYNIKSHAIFIYRKALKKGLIKGRSIIGMVCASLFFACRTFKIPILFQEIVNKASIKEKIARNCFKVLIKELKLKLIPLGPNIFVSRFINGLKLSPDIEKKVLNLLQTLRQFAMGRDPKVVCVAVIYLVCKRSKIDFTQKVIAKVSRISETSLRYTYKQIENYLLKKHIIFDLICS